MSQSTAAKIAALLSGQPDLYTALHKAAGQEGMAALAEVRGILAKGDATARQTADRLRSVDQGFLAAVMRAGAGFPAVPAAATVRKFLARQKPEPLFLPAIVASTSLALLTSRLPDMPAFSDREFDGWFAGRARGSLLYGLGPYGEKRLVYASDQFADQASPERRNIHLGIDVFAPTLTPIHAPLSGRVLHLCYNADDLDYGHTLILSHQADDQMFFTLYGHLAGTLPSLLKTGENVEAGRLIGHLGDWHENGGWAAHVHFQIMTDMLDQTHGNFFGVGHESLLGIWQEILIDPNLILQIPDDRFI